MSHQQPGWQPPQQQPQQGWGAPQQPQWGAPPPPPKKNPIGKILGFGCLGIVALFVVLGVIGAALSGNDSDTSTTSKPAASTPKEQEEKAPAEDAKADDAKPKPEEAKKEEPKKVVFKVWGTAPAGALGPLDINYGSDSDTRDGKWKNGKFEATLPYDEDAMYYTVMAQLQGSGDINCSVTVDGHTEKAHASGGYNICHAQANAGLLGGWD